MFSLTDQLEQGIKVIIRFKSFRNEEEKESCDWRFLSNTQVQLGDETKFETYYRFDQILLPSTSQADIYRIAASDKIVQFFKGYNGAILAYGATSSGKTYTLLGPETVEQTFGSLPEKLQIDDPQTTGQFGIIPRSFSDIMNHLNEVTFPELKEVQLKCSYLEIYKEMIYDLLADKNYQMSRSMSQKTISQKSHEGGTSLKIRETPLDGIQVMGLEERTITKESQLTEALSIGTKRRSISCTSFNARSSRSHTIFSLELTIRWKDQTSRTSRLHFVDLSGSERIAKQTIDKTTIDETKKINQSLSCLGFCIMALSSRKKKHIPYRDSKLTFLLKECLGGNSSTSFICTVCPANNELDKSLSTLKFAQRAKRIVNKVKINIKLSYQQMEKLVDQLKDEIVKMKGYMSLSGIRYEVTAENILQAYQESTQTNTTQSPRSTDMINEGRRRYFTVCKTKSSHHHHRQSSFSEEASQEEDELEDQCVPLKYTTQQLASLSFLPLKHMNQQSSPDRVMGDSDLDSYVCNDSLVGADSARFGQGLSAHDSSRMSHMESLQVHQQSPEKEGNVISIQCTPKYNFQDMAQQTNQRNLGTKDIKIFDNPIKEPDEQAVKGRNGCCQIF